MTLRSTIITLFITALFIYGCSKKETDEPLVPGSLKILALTATRDTLKAWDTTTIEVVTNLPANTIKWTADHGTIMGSGGIITYYAGTCCVGTNTITCRAEGNDGTDTASIRIHVTPYAP